MRKAEWEIDLPDLEQAVLDQVLTVYEALDAAYFMGQHGGVPTHVHQRLNDWWNADRPVMEDVELPPFAPPGL